LLAIRNIHSREGDAEGGGRSNILWISRPKKSRSELVSMGSGRDIVKGIGKNKNPTRNTLRHTIFWKPKNEKGENYPRHAVEALFKSIHKGKKVRDQKTREKVKKSIYLQAFDIG